MVTTEKKEKMMVKGDAIDDGSSVLECTRCNNEGNPQDMQVIVHNSHHQVSTHYYCHRCACDLRQGTSNAGSSSNRHDVCQYCMAFGTSRGDKVMTMCEVRRHSTETDCWIVARGVVYDVTSYLFDHPGGKRSLLRRAGGCQDCTEDLEFHSKRGKKVWERFVVGKVVSCSTMPHEHEGPACTLL